MNGYLLINKPTGLSSFSVLRQIRKILNIKRIGHCGTLDPLATGMLPVMIGQGTKYASLLISQHKCYTVTARFGWVSDTYDVDGTMHATPDYSGFSLDALQTLLPKYKGTITQQPPMYSAIRINGKRAYELARQGQKIDLPMREVSIDCIDIIKQIDEDAVQLRVACSKGTYIRSLVHDLGQALGHGAVVTQLHRDWVAPFVDQPMISLDTLSATDIIDLSTLFKQHYTLTQSELNAIQHGQSIAVNQSFTAEPIALLDLSAQFCGTGIMQQQRIQPKRLISYPDKQDVVATDIKSV